MFLTPQQRAQLGHDLLHVYAQQAHVNLHLAHVQRRRRRALLQQSRKLWVRQWLQRRPLYGMYEQLMGELEREDLGGFRNFIRMDPLRFYELLHRIADRITKCGTWYRKAIEPGLKLSIAQRYYAADDSYHSLMYSFRVAHNTISLIVRDVSIAIYEEFARGVISCPTTTAEWQAIADMFATRWQFLHTLGAFDGKHIEIRCPHNDGSLYYNYKGFHSIVLMALVDADYRFIWIDCGVPGLHSDAQVFSHSELMEAINDGSLHFSAAVPVPGDDRPVPFFIIGDDAFALKTWMMKPFGQRNLTHDERIFNYLCPGPAASLRTGLGYFLTVFATY